MSARTGPFRAARADDLTIIDHSVVGLWARWRSGISTFGLLPPAIVERAVTRLAEDLRSGAWEARFGDLRRAPALDLGYRLVVSAGRPG